MEMIKVTGTADELAELTDCLYGDCIECLNAVLTGDYDYVGCDCVEKCIIRDGIVVEEI